MSVPSLTSTSLLIAVAVVAVALPVTLVVTWKRHPHGFLGGALRLVVVIVCQALAVTGVGLAANNSFGFYNSWSDLLGTKASSGTPVSANTLVATDGSQGKIVSLSVPASGPGTPHTTRSLTVLAWLPPQYDAPQYRSTKFPVTMMLTGQPGTPVGVFKRFNFIQGATAAIADHSVAPFVAVFPR